jgi:hypothetical protein
MLRHNKSLMLDGISFSCKNNDERIKLKEILLKEKLRMIEEYSNKFKEEYN